MFVILLGPIACFIFIYFWIRDKQSKVGRHYPLMNSSFSVYSDFIERTKYNIKLKKKYHKLLILCFIISLVYIIFILFLMTKY